MSELYLQGGVGASYTHQADFNGGGVDLSFTPGLDLNDWANIHLTVGATPGGVGALQDVTIEQECPPEIIDPNCLPETTTEESDIDFAIPARVMVGWSARPFDIRFGVDAGYLRAHGQNRFAGEVRLDKKLNDRLFLGGDLLVAKGVTILSAKLSFELGSRIELGGSSLSPDFDMGD